MDLRKKTILLIFSILIALLIIKVTSYLFKKTEDTALIKEWKRATFLPWHKDNTFLDATDVVLQNDLLTGHNSDIINNGSDIDSLKQKVEDTSTLSKTEKANLHLRTTTSSKTERTGEVTHIEFLKVHKAASSTVQSIILRFGLERNLSFVIPTPVHYISKRKYYFSDIWPSLYETPSASEKVFEKGNIQPKYDILSHHMVFNHRKVSQLLHKDASYVAIVRDPFDIFVSAAKYYKFALRRPSAYLSKLSNKTFITDLIRNPKQFEATTNSESKTYNSMAYDFGLECLNVLKPEQCTDKIFAAFLDKTSEIFDVVMVVERFDESLVILKRYMHWSLRDILYTKINTFSSDQLSDSAASFNVTSTDMEIFRERNKFDYELYNLFKDRLEREIRSQKDFEEEVAQFRIILQDVQNFCTNNSNKDSSPERMAGGKIQSKISSLENALDVKNKDLLKSIKTILETKIVSRKQEEELFVLFDLVEKNGIDTIVPVSELLPLLFNDKVNPSKSKLFISKSKWNNGFYVTARDCDLMLKDIMSLYEVVKHSHLKKLIVKKFGNSFSLIEGVKYLSTFT